MPIQTLKPFRKLAAAVSIAMLATSNLPAANVPADYSVVAYVASSGAQYVNTGIVPKSTTRVVCDFRLPTLPSATILCGWGSRGSVEAFLFGASTTKFSAYVSATWVRRTSTSTRTAMSSTSPTER